MRLADIRQQRGLSRSDLHRALVRRGVNRCRSLLDRWENALSQPSASEIAHIAAVLNVPLSEFFDPTTDANKPA